MIYLIGAAWLPLGIQAVDRWVRLGRRWGLLELAIVLSMQTLGGDPQAAYLVGLVSIGYALGLAWSRTRVRSRRTARVARNGVGRTRGGCPYRSWSSRFVGWCAVTLLWRSGFPS